MLGIGVLTLGIGRMLAIFASGASRAEPRLTGISKAISLATSSPLRKGVYMKANLLLVYSLTMPLCSSSVARVRAKVGKVETPRASQREKGTRRKTTMTTTRMTKMTRTMRMKTVTKAGAAQHLFRRQRLYRTACSHKVSWPITVRRTPIMFAIAPGRMPKPP